MKVDILHNLLDDSSLVNDFKKVIKFEIKKQFFSGDGIFGTLGCLVLLGIKEIQLTKSYNYKV